MRGVRTFLIGTMFLFPFLCAAQEAQLQVQLQEQGIVSSVPAGSQRVPVLGMRLSASCEKDVLIDSITVQRKGAGDSADIASVYLASNGVRLSRGRTLERRDGRATILLRDVVVPACGYKDIDVYVDFSPDAALAAQHWFVLPDGARAIAADATVILQDTPQPTEFPRTISGQSTGNIQIEYLPLHRTVSYGSSRVVARFTLEADNQDDHLLRSILLTNNGSADDDDLRRLYLLAGRERVTTIAAQLDGERLQLTFSPALSLRKNQKRLFTLYADVRASRSKTIEFILQEPSDLDAVTGVARRRLQR